MTASKIIKVDAISRVEGEGALSVKINGDSIEEVKLKIFEPPRFFEALLRGRACSEAPDITARICGICPVAYQMSAVHAIESALDVKIPDYIRQLRRLLYCGEWIESHVLHVLFMHAPDFLGYTDLMAMAKDHRTVIESGLQIKKAGNRIIQVLGGREVHPINVCLGGFYRLPEPAALQELGVQLRDVQQKAWDLLAWVSNFHYPDVHVDYEYVSLVHDKQYPMNEGQIHSTKGIRINADEFERYFIEEHVKHSTALYAKTRSGEAYLTGPMARFALNHKNLSPQSKIAMRDFDLDTSIHNPFRSIQIRCLEVLYSVDEAIRIIDEYIPAERAQAELTTRASTGYAATEAPRGLLFHRYEMDKEGTIISARIVPPTSQNQRQIELDLAEVIASRLALPESELTPICEKVIRNYDPCISCAAHFLNLTIERS